MATSYAAYPSLLSVAAALILVAAPAVGARMQTGAESTPVVAVVARSGLMLPLAAFVDGHWIDLPWPARELGSPIQEFPIPVRRTLADLPREWVKPLAALPLRWRFQSLDGSTRPVEIGVPARWEGGLVESVGLTVRPWDDHGTETDDAGIAVSGEVEALRVRRLDGTSREWRGAVRALAPEFLAAERRWSRPKSLPGTPSLGRLTAELSRGEITLAEIRIDSQLSYWYLHTFLPRSPSSASRGAGCSDFAVHHGLIELRPGRGLRVRWLTGGQMPCGSLTEGADVVGAVRRGREVRVVARWGGDDWSHYRLVDPTGPESAFAPGPLPRLH